MSHSSDVNQVAPFEVNNFFETLKAVSRRNLGSEIEDDDDGFSPFPQEAMINEEDLKSLEVNFQEHNKLKPHLEDLLKLLNQKEVDGDEHTSISLRMSSTDRNQIITNLQKAQSDVESIQGQLSEMLSKGFFSNELEQHARILHKLSISAVADLLPKEIKEVLDKGKPQFQEITEISDERKIKDTEDTRLPPISNLNIAEEHVEKNGAAMRKAKPKKTLQNTPLKTNQLPEYLPYEPDECIMCEYFHVFGKHPVNLMKAYDKRVKEETAMRNNLENRTRRKKRQNRKK